MTIENVEMDIKEYSKLVYRTAMSILKSKHDAEDIFQEVFIKLYERKEDFNDEEHKKAWLIRVTINECKSLLRRSWYKNRNELDENIKATENEGDNVFYVVERLPLKYRTVILLYYYERYKEKEISEILHVSEGAVKSRLFRARKMLKEKLKGGFENE